MPKRKSWAERIREGDARVAAARGEAAPAAFSSQPIRTMRTKKSLRALKLFRDRVELPDGTHLVSPDTTAAVESAGNLSTRTSLTRVVGGAALFGGVGAIVGAGARKKKDARELYLAVSSERGTTVVELHPSEGAEARVFAAAINTAARRSTS